MISGGIARYITIETLYKYVRLYSFNTAIGTPAQVFQKVYLVTSYYTVVSQTLHTSKLAKSSPYYSDLDLYTLVNCYIMFSTTM